MLLHVTPNKKSVWYLSLSLIGLSALFSNNVQASASGCDEWSGTFPLTPGSGIQNSDHLFVDGQYAKVVVTNSGATQTYTFTYTDTANGGAVITRSGSVANGETITTTITVPQDSTNATLNFSASAGGGGTLSAVFSCVASAPASPSDASTTSVVVAAVSRSQINVVQKNIGSRVSTLANSVSPAPTTPAGNTPQKPAESSFNLANRGSFGFTPYAEDYSISGSRNGMRQLAMMGDFDSSAGSILSGLNAGQGVPGAAGGIDGRMALETSSPLTLWGHGSFTSVDNDYVSGGADNRYDGDVWGYNLGIDYSFTPVLTAGVSIGYNDTNLNTAFNDGSYDEKGWLLATYAIYRPINGLMVVGELGYGQGSIDVTRDNDAVTGETDSDMWYAALTTSYKLYPNASIPLSLTPSVAFIAARKHVDGYTESDATQVASTRSDTQQINPSVEAAYSFYPKATLTLTPFIETGLIYDFTDALNDDKAAFNIGGGMRISDSATGLSAALEASYLAGRTDYTEYTIGATVAWSVDLQDDKGRSLGIFKPFFGGNRDEYGGQRLRTGIGFTRGGLSSEIALEHVMSVANDEAIDEDATGYEDSRIRLNLSILF